MYQDFISVIVPIYNCDMYIEKCIKSIINQTYKNLQIILIDDGSEDKSGNICDNYAKVDSRIEVYHTKNNGVSAARNYGLSKVKGEFVSFIDADDFLEREMYDKMIKKFENGIDMVVCNFSTIEESVKKELNFIPNIILDKKSCIKELLLNRYLMGALWNKIIRYKNLEDIKFNEKISMGEDLLFQYNVIKRIKNAQFIADYLYNYRLSQNNVTNKSNYEKWIQFVNVTKLILDDIKNEYPELEKYAIIKYINSNMFVLSKISINTFQDKKNVIMIMKNIEENKKIYIKSKDVAIKTKIKLYISLIKYRIILGNLEKKQ